MKLHSSTLWNTQTVIGPSRRFFSFSERLLGPAVSRVFHAYLNACDRVTESELPIVRFLGSRQFVSARKPL